MKQAKFTISEHFLQNTTAEWPEIWHVDVFWPLSELIRFWSVCWYSSFWHHFDLVKQVKFGIFRIFFRMHERNGLKFDMLMYPDHLRNWVHLGHGLLVSLFWRHFDLVKQVKCALSRHFRDIVWEEWAEISHVHLLSCDIPRNEKKRQILAHENHHYRVGGYPWLLCSQTFLVFSCDQAALWLV